MSLPTATLNLVRMIAVDIVNGKKSGDAIILDVFVDKNKMICAGEETLGYRVTSQGTRGAERFDLLRLGSDLQIEEYEDVTDGTKTRQRNVKWGIPHATCVEVGAKFVDGGNLDGEQPLEIAQTTIIASGNEVQKGTLNYFESELVDDFRVLSEEDKVSVLRHASALRMAATLGGSTQ